MRHGFILRIVAPAILLLSLVSLFLTACGDRAELPEKGFVMGIAMDDSGQDNIDLSVQIFKPSQSVTGKGKTGKAYINIHTKDQSVIEAIRDITIHLGRKAQWSHMRVILISEALARKVPLLRLLDFFYRDHEPRLTSHVLITRGKAFDYLNSSPYIENSISQQYFLGEKASHEFAGKTARINLLELALQARSQSAVALLPYLYKEKTENEKVPATNVAGSAVLVDGRIKEIIPASLTEGVQLLQSRYKSGILEVPCAGGSTGSRLLQEDAFEVLHTETSMKVRIDGDRPLLVFRNKSFVAASELICGKALMPQDDLIVQKRVRDTIVKNMTESIEWMLDKHIDLVGAGNIVYEKNPRLWKQWKADWPARFASSGYEMHAEVILVSTGTNIGKPVYSDR
ncbi:Ger(x)C family spore germination protein [Cohnella cholangitidis]|uniref:Ger(X)C family spore germination protein n=1 Tax=Cohnella cholangitidis TaxID=2598458 RepID=A0A7G5C132_9BACL|nr:Ger(x)C family spore germination protein [Cohnella cholangitidis]QMV42916.1 Ger(x)C family spore germination protein [Cohnella cholangitidis]